MQARLLRILILNEEQRVPALHETAKALVFAEKSVPTAESFATGACFGGGGGRSGQPNPTQPNSTQPAS